MESWLLIPPCHITENQKIPYILSSIRNAGAEKCFRTRMHSCMTGFQPSRVNGYDVKKGRGSEIKKCGRTDTFPPLL